MSASVHFEPRFERSAADRLSDEITELCGYIYAATCHLLELIREFDEARYWEEQGFKSCAHWLNFKCGMGLGTAREHLRVASALQELPKISEEFAEGKLSFSKARAMTRVARPENEEFLLMVARHGTANHVERLVSQYRRCQKLNHPDTANDLFMAREMTYHYDDDGCLVLKARMPADMGELIVKALEMAMDDVGARLAGDNDGEQPIAARRADALVEVAETYLNHPENSGSTADRYQVVVNTTGNGASQLENGPHVEPKAPLSAETSRRIACDCCTSEVEVDRTGEPLNIGRRSRTIPPAIRRALKARDGGCRFPGCTSHKFCDGHHIKHWSDGGETSLDNLVLLCRYHHRLVHEGGFDCKRSSDGEIYFEDRRHERLNEFQRTAPVSIEESLAWMYRMFADQDVSADNGALGSTPVAKWYAGEEMDMEYAVWVMANAKPPG